MKKNLLISLILVNLYNCKAQTIYNLGTPPEQLLPRDNFYLKDINNHHDTIVGVWQWEDGNSSFEITLQEFEHNNYPSNSNQYSDDIFGKYKYIFNGAIVGEAPNIITYPNFYLSVNYKTPNKYSVVITDVVSGKGKIGEFTLITSNTATLELWDTGGIKVGGTISLTPFSLPTSVTLTKQ